MSEKEKRKDTNFLESFPIVCLYYREKRGGMHMEILIILVMCGFKILLTSMSQHLNCITFLIKEIVSF